jgi:hypothetical protein
MKFSALVLWAQTIYYLLTSLWALVDIESFMKVSGPKKDIWLVKTVAVLLLAICFSFITAIVNSNPTNPPILVLAVSCCILLACIDFYYAGRRVIWRVYFIDGFLQLLLLACWVAVIII